VIRDALDWLDRQRFRPKLELERRWVWKFNTECPCCGHPLMLGQDVCGEVVIERISTAVDPPDPSA
jgi:hypothetical protein